MVVVGLSSVIGAERDKSSCANFVECTIRHFHLQWKVNFDAKVFRGCAELNVYFLQENVTKIKLDTKSLKIFRVYDKSSQKDLNFALENGAIECFGQNLFVELPSTPAAGSEIVVVIEYETSPIATALQWLNAEQTEDRLYPFLFSQASSTNYEVPIPSYLLAIVVGWLESRGLSERCAVWSEPSLADRCQYEFAKTEDMLKIAEDLFGPYVWGRYDILVLPPSFPYGGMENPCLTFCTPTLLAGDRSLTYVVAHEIAHSWTGNLVTNATWDDFWLNEGHTTFAERKISGKLAHSEAHRHFLAFNGWKSLEYAVNEQFSPTDPLTKLVLDMEMVDPDDGYSPVAYEKGHTLLFHLEELVGGPEVFEEFLRSYLRHFMYKSITTDIWRDYLLTYFKQKGLDGKLKNVDWNSWFYNVGMPPLKPKYDETLVEQCTKLCEKWACASEEKVKKFTSEEYFGLSGLQREEFLSQLLSKDPLPHFKLEKMEELYQLSATKNCDIRFAWIRLGLKGRWKKIESLALDFITMQGRLKYTKPIYKDLLNWDETKPNAVETFHRNRPYMHITTASDVTKLLGEQ